MPTSMFTTRLLNRAPALALAALLGSSTALHAATPATPGGLCIETPDGMQCAAVTPTPTVVTGPTAVNAQNFHPGYYMAVGRNDGTWAFDQIKSNPNFAGVKKYYSWRYLEPTQGQYDFSAIESDLQYLQALGKRMFIEIQWGETNSAYSPHTPTYMWKNSMYGCSSNYYGTYERTVQQGGWLLCSWNSNVKARVAALFTALGKRFNAEPYFEGVILMETSTGYPGDANASAWGYSGNAEKEAYMANALAVKKAFPSKTVIQHINYAAFDLTSFASWLVANGIGIGTPDVYLNKPTNPVTTVIYPLMLSYHNAVPIAPEVQWSNYVDSVVAPGDANIAESLLEGSVKMINPHYLFWEKRDDYFATAVVPAVKTYGLLPAAKTFYTSN